MGMRRPGREPALPRRPCDSLRPRLSCSRSRQGRVVIYPHEPSSARGASHHSADGRVNGGADQVRSLRPQAGACELSRPPVGDGELDNLGFTKQVLEKYENGACQKYFLAAGGTMPTPAENQQRLEQLLKIAKCMRAHGIVDFPDPSSQGGFKIPVPVADEPGDTAAAKVCGAPPA